MLITSFFMNFFVDPLRVHKNRLLLYVFIKIIEGIFMSITYMTTCIQINATITLKNQPLFKRMMVGV